MANGRRRRPAAARPASAAAHLRLPQRCHIAGFEIRLRRRPPASAQRPEDVTGHAQQPAAGWQPAGSQPDSNQQPASAGANLNLARSWISVAGVASGDVVQLVKEELIGAARAALDDVDAAAETTLVTSLLRGQFNRLVISFT